MLYQAENNVRGVIMVVVHCVEPQNFVTVNPDGVKHHEPQQEPSMSMYL